MYIYIYYIYICIKYIYICRNKLETGISHKLHPARSACFLSHCNAVTRVRTAILRLLLCINTPRAV